MRDEHKSIHAFDLELICEYFSNLERQGPGSPEVTINALRFIDNLNDKSLIADIGCGSGGQTMVLAQHAPGNIRGIDLFPNWKKDLNRMNIPGIHTMLKIQILSKSRRRLTICYNVVILVFISGGTNHITTFCSMLPVVSCCTKYRIQSP